MKLSTCLYASDHQHYPPHSPPNTSRTPLMLQVLQACLTYAVAYLRSGRTHDGALLCRLLAALGPTFVKLGQLLSVRPDLLGEQLSQQLSSLQVSRGGTTWAAPRALSLHEWTCCLAPPVRCRHASRLCLQQAPLSSPLHHVGCCQPWQLAFHARSPSHDAAHQHTATSEPHPCVALPAG
jgi:hypothetical protein